MQEKGVLYVCATPIGNLSDCSERVVSTLSFVDHVAAEDTRVTLNLLGHFAIKTPLVSLQKFNEASRVDLFASWLSQGKNIALVSDAGTPNISDPGSRLIRDISSRGFSVIPIPGPSSITALLSVSGLLADHFYFGGFLPKKSSESLTLLDSLKTLRVPLVFFDSPKRIEKTVSLIEASYPLARIVLGKELTKTYEWIFRGTISEAVQAIQTVPIKGEWCFVVLLNHISENHVESVVLDLKERGMSLSQVLHVATTLLGYPKNTVYSLFHGGKS
jgi:16S rRNA (cytidine1402-2'-O)-methyltransferase